MMTQKYRSHGLFITVYVLYKVGSYLFKIFFLGASGYSEARFEQNDHRRRGDINIDYVPKGRDKSSKGYQGGDYIDYEEVKD